MTSERTKPAAVVALIAVAFAVVLILLRGGGDYTLHAHFLDAGQLVKGGRVEVAGRKVGSITGLSLTPDGEADVELSIDDDSITPLHLGTRASIRALGQAGVANRFVDLSPGSQSAAKLDSGSTLPLEQTASIVNLDAVLDSFGPQQRANLQKLIANSAEIYAGSGSRDFNQMLAKLDPALSQAGEVASELGSDQKSLRKLIASAGTDAAVLASRRTDIEQGLTETARALEAVARRRGELGDALARAPRVLDQATTTLADASVTLTALRPSLREVPPVAKPLGRFLSQTRSTLPQARPVAKELRRQLPGLRQSLAGLQPLERPAVDALGSAQRALADSRHITYAARLYGSDLLLGVLNGLAGVATANHDRWGHYARLEFTQPPQTTVGPLAPLLTANPLIPGLIDLKTRQLRRCPGSNTPAAPDHSNPWLIDTTICDPTEIVSPTVNQP